MYTRRAPAAAQQGRRPWPADQGHRQVRVGGLPLEAGPHPGHRPARRDDHQLEPDERPAASAPPTTPGATTARSAASTCSTRTSTASRTSEGKWTLASVTSAMNAAATQDVRAIDTVPLLKRLLKGSQAPDRGLAADAGAAGRLEEQRRQPPRPRPRRQDRRSRAPRSWTSPGRRSPTRSWRRGWARSSTSSTRCSAASTCRRAASTTAGISTSTATSAACWG